MTRKLTLLLAAVVVVAFAAPAAASAAPSFTNTEGKLLPKGTVITTTSTNWVTTTALGNVSCEKWQSEGEITENTGTSAKATGLGEGKTTGCTIGGKATALTDVTWKNLSLTGAGTGTIFLTWKVDASPITCHFEGTVAFTFTTNTNIIHVKGAVVPSPSSCGSAGSASTSATLTILGFGGGAVILT